MALTSVQFLTMPSAVLIGCYTKTLTIAHLCIFGAMVPEVLLHCILFCLLYIEPEYINSSLVEEKLMFSSVEQNGLLVWIYSGLKQTEYYFFKPVVLRACLTQLMLSLCLYNLQMCI